MDAGERAGLAVLLTGAWENVPAAVGRRLLRAGTLGAGRQLQPGFWVPGFTWF